MTDRRRCRRVELMKASILHIYVFCFITSGCSLITVPVKTAGSIVTTTVSTTGKVVTAPFNAVGRSKDDKEDQEDTQKSRTPEPKPSRRGEPVYE